jgi:hypothetical protein
MDHPGASIQALGCLFLRILNPMLGTVLSLGIAQRTPFSAVALSPRYRLALR